MKGAGSSVEKLIKIEKIKIDDDRVDISTRKLSEKKEKKWEKPNSKKLSINQIEISNEAQKEMNQIDSSANKKYSNKKNGNEVKIIKSTEIDSNKKNKSNDKNERSRVKNEVNENQTTNKITAKKQGNISEKKDVLKITTTLKKESGISSRRSKTREDIIITATNKTLTNIKTNKLINQCNQSNQVIGSSQINKSNIRNTGQNSQSRKKLL